MLKIIISQTNLKINTARYDSPSVQASISSTAVGTNQANPVTMVTDAAQEHHGNSEHCG